MKQKYIVGDLVYLDGKVRKIAAINDGGQYHIKVDDGTAIVEPKEIKGIPITPKILIKNGWEKPIGFESYWLNNVGLLQNNDKWEVAIGTIGLAFKITNIKSVSDLQHLLFGLGLKSDMEV